MSIKTLLAKLYPPLRRNRELEAKIAEKNETLQRVRHQVAQRDRELAKLRAELARARVARQSPGLTGGGMPVFFVVGRARSGTTWLRSILNAHPEILCRGEGRFFERSFRREDFEQWRLENIPPSSLYGAILESKYLRAWIERSVWTGAGEVDKHLADLTRLAIDHFLAQRLSETNKRIVGDKTPFVSAEFVEEIGAIYPEARVIHIIRDGRDVAVSIIHHMWNYPKNEGGLYDLEPEELKKRDAYRGGSLASRPESLFTKERLIQIATVWSTEVGRVIEDGPALLGSNYTEVRYEHLLARPVEEVRRLLDFLGTDASEAMATRCVDMAGFERGSSRKRGQEDSSSRSRKGIVGDWENVFTEDDKSGFKEIAGDLLIKLGYEKSHDW
jgi:LPS sulfotransferase NodH